MDTSESWTRAELVNLTEKGVREKSGLNKFLCVCAITFFSIIGALTLKEQISAIEKGYKKGQRIKF